MGGGAGQGKRHASPVMEGQEAIKYNLSTYNVLKTDLTKLILLTILVLRHTRKKVNNL